jgi:hypothetical protein
MVKEDEMKWLTQLTLVACLCCIPLTASWADTKEIMAILASDTTEEFGHGVANARDLNGDGYDDLAVRTPMPSTVYLYWGGPSFDTIPDLKLTSGDTSLGVFEGAGDVNGDGYSDLMVCAYGGRESVNLYYGGNPMDSVPDLTLNGKAERELFGQTMSYAGDLNGDGYDDAFIGAYDAPNGGKAYIFFGGNPMDTIPDLILKTTSGSAFGMGVGGLGDVNGDGYPDVGVGDPWKSSRRGELYIYFGGPDMDRYPEYILKGLGYYGHFGRCVTGCDLNGDGYAEIVVGATTYGNGRIYVYRGGPRIPSHPDLTLAGRVTDDSIGREMWPVGDLDKDGYDEFATGTDAYAGCRVYVYYGGRRVDRDIDLVFPNGTGGVYEYGIRFAGIDINGDGRQELCVGSRREDRAYIYLIRHNQFTIALKPDTRKVAGGGELGFTATITNNTGKDQSLYFWVDLLDTEGRPFGDAPYLGPKHKTIPAHKTIIRHLTMEVGYWDVGPWTCTVKADTTEPQSPWLDFIENSSFEFEIVSNKRGFGHSFLSRIF